MAEQTEIIVWWLEFCSSARLTKKTADDVGADFVIYMDNVQV